MKNNKITPTPWELDLSGSGIFREGTSQYIGQVKSDTKKSKANAAFIVKCVNQSPKFEEMVALLKSKMAAFHPDIVSDRDSYAAAIYDTCEELLKTLEVGDE